MAFPNSSISAGSVLGKPRTGLHPSVVYNGKHIRIWDGTGGAELNHPEYAYLLWELRMMYPDIVGFFDANTDNLWVYAECNRRWWTPDARSFVPQPPRTTPPKDTLDGIIRQRKTNNRGGGGINQLLGSGQRIPGLSGNGTGGFGGVAGNANAVTNFINNSISNGSAGTSGIPQLPNGPLIGRDPATYGRWTESQRGNGLVWSSWDNIRGQWISRSGDLCAGGRNDSGDVNPPPSDIPSTPFPTGKIYTRIDSMDKLPQRSETITYGLWSDGVGNLTTFFTASLSGSVQPYHQTVLNKAIGACGSTPQFDIAYGNDNGSGSVDLGGYDRLTPTNATYGQYRLLCLGERDGKFKIGARELDHVYIVNIKQDRMMDRIDEGNIELNLAHLSGSEFVSGGGSANAHTGSNVTLAGNGQVLRLIDDSRINFDSLSTTALTSSYLDHSDVRAHRTGHGGDFYYMVSGSIEQGIHDSTNPHVYGLIYPKLGVIVLDADLMDSTASFGTVVGTEVEGDNAMKLFTAISGAAQYTDASGDVLGFQARRKETQYSEYYFIRVKNADYNYSNNPTFMTGSDGQINDNFIEEPKVYFSTIGLYNERRECIAIGKVSRPIQKTCTSEALFKVRLRY
jgi:hypothetical protein